MYSSRVIADMAEFADLRADWTRLFQLDDAATVFNSFEWAWCWLQCYWRDDWRLHVVTIAHGERVVALFPLYLRPAEHCGMFIGTGEPEHEEVSTEYLDVLVDPAHATRPELRAAMIAGVDALRAWQLELRNCRPGSYVAQALRGRRLVLGRKSGLQFQLEIGADFDATAVQFSAKQKKRSRQLLRQFERGAGLEYIAFAGADHAEYWQLLKTVHQEDWQARGGTGALGAETFNRFHRCMHEQAPQFAQLFSVLKKDGQVLAINHYYRHRNRYSFYLTGTNRREAGQSSPGQLLHYLCIRELGGSGAHYDFLKGRDADSYKRKFCEPGPPFMDFTVYPDTLGGRLGYAVRRLRRSLAAWRARIFTRPLRDLPAPGEQGRV